MLKEIQSVNVWVPVTLRYDHSFLQVIWSEQVIITQRDQHQMSIGRISINKQEFLSTNTISINRADLVCKFCFCDHPQTITITPLRNWELKTLYAITLEILISFNKLNYYQHFRGSISVLQIDFAKTVWDS